MTGPEAEPVMAQAEEGAEAFAVEAQPEPEPVLPDAEEAAESVAAEESIAIEAEAPAEEHVEVPMADEEDEAEPFAVEAEAEPVMAEAEELAEPEAEPIAETGPVPYDTEPLISAGEPTAASQAIPLPPAAVTVEEPVQAGQDGEPVVVLEPAASVEPTLVLGAGTISKPEVAWPEVAWPAEPSAPARPTFREELIGKPARTRGNLGRTLLVAGIVLIVGGATFGIVKATQSNKPVPRHVVTSPPAPTVQSPSPPVNTVAVPPLAGLTVAEARIALVQAGLEPGTVLPEEGPPGEITRSLPPSGTQVSPHSSVTLYVGVPPDRGG